MSGLTRDLLPENLIARLRALEQRVRVLETALARTAAGGAARTVIVYDRETGEAFELYMETIDDVPVLWYEAVEGGE
jgi:hypothetical protein